MRSFLSAALVALATIATAADVRVITTSGGTVDGVGIASIDGPQATSGRGTIFRSSSTTLTLGGVTVRTGDPLPPPLRGTIDTISQGVVAGDQMAFLATTSGPDVSAAIVHLDGGSLTPLVTVAPADRTGISRFAMNTAGDIVYHTRTGNDGTVHFRAGATGTSVPITEPSSGLATLHGLVIDDDGAAAWMDRRAGVSYWTASVGVRTISQRDTRPRPIANASPVALGRFGLAFVTRKTAVHWIPDTGDSTRLAGLHDTRGGVRLTRLEGDIGFRDDGAIALRVRGKPSVPSGYFCFGPGPIGSPCAGPGRSSAGTVLPAQRSTAIVEASGARLEARVRPGTIIPDAGVLADVTAHVVDGDDIVFTGVLDDGRNVLARWQGGVITPIATDDTIDLSGPLFDAGDRGALLGDEVTGSLTLVRNSGRPQPLHYPSRKRFRSTTTAAALMVGKRILALGGDAVFVARGRVLRPLVVASRRSMPSAIRLVARDDTRVIYAALGDNDAYGVYEPSKRGMRFLGTLVDTPSLLAVGGQTVAALTPTIADDGSAGPDSLTRIGLPYPIGLIRVGDSTAVGEIASIDGITVAGDEVVFSAGLIGDGARRALLAVAAR